MKSSKYALLFATIIAASASVASEDTSAVPPVLNDKPVAQSEGVTDSAVIAISDSEFNRIVFPRPFVDVVFPAKTPLKGKPLPLSGNRSVLFQVEPGSRSVIQMIVQLDDGSVRMLRLRPMPGPGVVHRVDGARDVLNSESGLSEATETSTAPATRHLVDVFSRFMKGGEPDGFEPVANLAPVDFPAFTAVPLESWSNGTERMLVYRLTAKGSADVKVAPPQFYRKGVRAIQIEGDRIAPGVSPELFLLVDEAAWVEAR